MNDAPPKVLFVLPRMVIGGVERVTLHVARGLIGQGMQCRLGLRHVTGGLLPEAKALMPVHALGHGALRDFVSSLAQVLCDWQPTHIVTAFSDVAMLTLLARRRSGVRAALVHGVHNVHAAIGAQRGGIGWVRHRVGNLLAVPVYAQADAVVAVSRGIATEIQNNRWMHPRRLRVIYNPVIDGTDICGDQRGRPRVPPSRMVSIGRLEQQKGFDLLVQSVATLRKSSDWILDIWGEGSERPRLQRQIRDLGLDDRVRLRGNADRPLEVMRDYGLFIMASRWEGFGNTLVEAMAMGLAVIAVDCPYGPREILLGGKLGMLVPGHELTSTIAEVLGDSARIDVAPLLRRAADFTVQKSVLNWAMLLREVGNMRPQ
jgi:glycosyltransferase involved in cell wall biosynthesis